MSKTSVKIPSDYFLIPELAAFIALPISFGLLPIAGFCPEFLTGYVSANIFAFILKYQVNYCADFISLNLYVFLNLCTKLLCVYHRCAFELRKIDVLF